MRNLKKLLAVIVAICVLASFTVPAFAATSASFTYADQAKKLYDMKLYAGNSATSYVPDLGSKLTREQGIILLVRMFGKEKEALAMTDEATVLAKYTDAAKVSSWAKKYVAYAVKTTMVSGTTATTLDAAGKLTGNAMATMILKNLGFTVDPATYSTNAATLATKGGLTADEATKFASKELIRDDVVGIMFGSLKAKDSNGKVVIDNLVASGAVTADAAKAAGVYTSVALDVSSAVAINSKVVEVTLATAATSADLTGVTVKDSAAKDVAVSKIEFAPWATNGKDILVTLGADTTAGTYYTLTAGTKSVNFGGKAADTTKPKFSKVTVNDYNEIAIQFTEPVLLGGTVEAAMKYGAKTALAVSKIEYSAADTIKVTTADQTAATLYTLAIKSFTDLAGNKMDDDTAQTFVGTAKSTAAIGIKAITAVDSLTFDVQFDNKIDAATCIDAANYSVAMKYGAKTAIVVSKAVAKADTTDTVTLTLASDTTAATLYEVVVKAGVKTKYGIATTAELKGTVVGLAKDTDALPAPVAKSTSNTKVTVTFPATPADNVDTTTAKEMFAIKEKYGSKNALAISAIKIEKNVVTLTTAAQSGVLYELTITKGIKDAKGNATTADIVTTFVGSAVAAKIGDITSATVDATDNTLLKVVFDQNVAADANDVSKYTIDNGIGYPTKAVIDSTNANQVNLTIPKTVDGKIYKLTVKGLANADGVAMDAAGITENFTGKGVSATKAEVQAVVAVDNQTLKIFFDRAVTDPTITGPIWSGTTLVANAIKVTNVNAIGAGALTALDSLAEYAYADPDNTNALIVRVPTNDAFKTLLSGQSVMTLTPDPTKTVNTAALQFAPNAAEPTAPELLSVVALDKQTIRLYFSEKVDTTNVVVGSGTNAGNNIRIYAAEAATDVWNNATRVMATTMTKVNDTTYDIGLNTDLDANCVTSSGGTTKVTNGQVYVYVVSGGKFDATGTGAFLDRTKTVELKVDDATSKVYVSRLLGTSSTAVTADSIADISILATDKRTLEVYFPEAMNTTAGGAATKVTTPANYKLVTTSAGTTGASVISVPKFVEFDSTTNKATLYFGADINTATDGTNLLTNFYLAMEGDMQNATLTKNVKDEVASGLAVVGNGLVRQFAASTTASGKPAIASATIDDSRKKITVVFGRKVTFGAATSDFTTGTETADEYITTSAGVTYADGGTTNEQDKVTNALKLTAVRGDGTAIAETMDYTGTNDAVTSVKRLADNKTIEINLAYALKAGTTATIEMLPGANLVASWTDVTNETTAADVSKATIGIPATSLFQADTTAPTVAGTSVLGNAGVAGTIEANDTITLDFSEAMTPTAFGAASVNVVVSSASPSVIKIYKGATSTAAADLIATITLTAGQFNNHASADMTFNSSDAAWSDSDTLLITLKNLAGGTVNTGVAAATNSIVMSGSILYDAAGNTIGTAAVTGASGRF